MLGPDITPAARKAKELREPSAEDAGDTADGQNPALPIKFIRNTVDRGSFEGIYKGTFKGFL